MNSWRGIDSRVSLDTKSDQLKLSSVGQEPNIISYRRLTGPPTSQQVPQMLRSPRILAQAREARVAKLQKYSDRRSQSKLLVETKNLVKDSINQDVLSHITIYKSMQIEHSNN